MAIKIFIGIMALAVTFLIFYMILVIGIGNKAKKLTNKFRKLGNLKGLTCKDIESYVGKADEYIHYNNGNKRVTWKNTGYIISILFDKKDKFIKILIDGNNVYQ